MKPNKICSVILLPTLREDAEYALLACTGSNSGKFLSPRGIHYGLSLIPQHIYFVSNENIKEKDWCINPINDVVFSPDYATLCEGVSHCKKIVATTNPQLKDIPKISEQWVSEFIACRGKINEVELKQGQAYYNGEKLEMCMRNPALKGLVEIFYPKSLIVSEEELTYDLALSDKKVIIESSRFVENGNVTNAEDIIELSPDAIKLDKYESLLLCLGKRNLPYDIESVRKIYFSEYCTDKLSDNDVYRIICQDMCNLFKKIDLIKSSDILANFMFYELGDKFNHHYQSFKELGLYPSLFLYLRGQLSILKVCSVTRTHSGALKTLKHVDFTEFNDLNDVHPA